VSLDEDVRAELRELEARHRLRIPRVVDGMHGPRITLDGVDVINAASNDYLSLAGDRRLARAAANALDEYGTGAGASRLITGTHRRHVALEHALADWLQFGATRLFNTGYAANVGVLTALLRAGDVVFSDELNHASIIDGCRLSRADVVVFPHRDVAALERALATRTGRRRIVISETLFSMDGDIADVEALAALCNRHDAALILDEAHAIGVWGPEGRGIAAEAGVVPDVLIGTCGKALGGFGAFAASSPAIADLLWNRARPFVFSTALPPSIPAAVHAAVEIVRGTDGEERRRNLVARAVQLRMLLSARGLSGASVAASSARSSVDGARRTAIAMTAGDDEGAPASSIAAGGHSHSAIAPVIVGDDQRVMAISAALLEQRVFVQGIRPPTVAEGTARLRISLCARHSADDVDAIAAAVVAEAGRFT
jgi:8-amino-7-oxononanoate synthase